jgi:hypothetical protein
VRDFLKNTAALLIGLLLSAGLLEIGLRLANCSRDGCARRGRDTSRSTGHQWAGEHLAEAVCKLLEQGAGRAPRET